MATWSGTNTTGRQATDAEVQARNAAMQQRRNSSPNATVEPTIGISPVEQKGSQAIQTGVTINPVEYENAQTIGQTATTFRPTAGRTSGPPAVHDAAPPGVVSSPGDFYPRYGDSLNNPGVIPDSERTNERLPYLSATLARAQWEDYKARFQPIEDALMARTVFKDPGMVDREIAASMPQVQSAINTSQAIHGRRLASLGQTPTVAQKAASDKEWALTRAMSMSDAANRIRQNIADRSRTIAFGGASPVATINQNLQTAAGDSYRRNPQ